jgi:sulfotransferase
VTPTPAHSRLYFISGLPRSGSSLLAAIVRQNPAIHAGMSGPMCGIVASLLRSMSSGNEYSRFVSDDQRRRIIAAAFNEYYADLSSKQIIFDTNREWTAHLPLLSELFPATKVICCLRSPAWILDSIERRIQAIPFARTKLFPAEVAENVYLRSEYTLKKGLLSLPMQSLRQAWFGAHADRLIGVRYDSLVAHPAAVINRLYECLGLPPFPHDFENLVFDEPEFDAQLGVPELHKVRRRVEPNERVTILPPDIFNSNDRSFWDVPGQNPRGVTVL